MERVFKCSVDNVMPTEECNVDVNGLPLMLRDGVKAAQFILNTATTTRIKWESRLDTEIIVWIRVKEERLLFFRLCEAALPLSGRRKTKNLNSD
jgi:hypothetical protein